MVVCTSMADEYKEEASDRTKKEEKSKDEGDEEEIVDGRKEEGTVADVKKDEMNVERKNEGSTEIKEEATSESFTENLNKSGSEMNTTGNDMEETTGMVREEKPKPIKRGLLDEPVVREGKRQRHAVERLAAVSSPSSRKTSLDAVGLCYGTPGTATSRKRDLRRFNGFAFDEKSADFDKKKATAMKFTNNELHMIGRILGSERGHTKEEAVMNVLHFLQKPEDKGRKVTSAKKRRSSSKSTGKRAKKSNEEKGNKKNIKKSKEESSEDDDAGQSGEESSGDGDIEEKKSTSTTESRSERMKSSTKLASVSKSTVAKDDSSWGDGGPSNAEVETTINEILRSVDLVNCTMKQMCERIAEKFPNLDMATYKGALKERVKVALEKMEDS
ncbi:unnamed protein product [Brugia timori]|uniref:DEK_C domain-containing protein n=1 Tax=Brugia timori TaxID=42155 RepID=A0A0R3QSU6_9BILA|nr:unnamed protein product [Brugia timori]